MDERLAAIERRLDELERKQDERTHVDSPAPRRRAAGPMFIWAVMITVAVVCVGADLALWLSLLLAVAAGFTAWVALFRSTRVAEL